MILISENVLPPFISCWVIFVGILNLFALFGESNSSIQKICPHSNLWMTIIPTLTLTVYGVYVGTLDAHVYGIIFNFVLFSTFITYVIYELSLQCTSNITDTATYPSEIINLIILCVICAINFAHILKICCVSSNTTGENSLLLASRNYERV